MYFNKQGERVFPLSPENCYSTHGAAGYAVGTFINPDGYLICGICGLCLGPASDLEWLPSWLKTATSATSFPPFDTEYPPSRFSLDGIKQRIKNVLRH